MAADAAALLVTRQIVAVDLAEQRGARSPTQSAVTSRQQERHRATGTSPAARSRSRSAARSRRVRRDRALCARVRADRGAGERAIVARFGRSAHRCVQRRCRGTQRRCARRRAIVEQHPERRTAARRSRRPRGTASTTSNSVTSGSRYSTSSVSKPATSDCALRRLAGHRLDAHAQEEDQRDREARDDAEPHRRHRHRRVLGREADARCREQQHGHQRVAGEVVEVAEAARLAADAREFAVGVVDEVRQHDRARTRRCSKRSRRARARRAPARPIASRSVVRWFGVTRVSFSGVTSRRASRPSQVRGSGAVTGGFIEGSTEETQDFAPGS